MPRTKICPWNALVRNYRVACRKDPTFIGCRSDFLISTHSHSFCTLNTRFSRQLLLPSTALAEASRQLSSGSAGNSSDHESNNKEDVLDRRRLDVAIVGAPNAGKSQLLNVLTNSPVAAVSRKRHTTRSGIMAVRTVNDTQIVFVDTPGFLKLDHAKQERLDADLIATAASEMKHVDYTLLVVDAARILSDTYRQALVSLMLNAIHSEGRSEFEDEDYDNIERNSRSQDAPNNPNRSKFAIVLNKIDLVQPKSTLLDLAMDIGAVADECLRRVYLDPNNNNKQTRDNSLEEENLQNLLLKVGPVVFYVSALERDGTDDLLQHLIRLATPSKEWPLPPNETTDLSPQERVQEIIREKIYRCTHKEVPHSVAQVNRIFRRVPQGLVIHQDLVVFTKSHRSLLRGFEGKTLQRIEETACRDLKELFKCDVSLNLHVKLNKTKQRQGDLGKFSREEMGVTIETLP